MHRIRIRDVVARDGLQGERPVPVDQRVELIARLVSAGLGDIEVAAFVSSKAVPAMAGAADVVVGGPGADASSRCHAVGARAQRKRRRAGDCAAGVDHLTITISASAAYSEKNVQMTISQALEQVARSGRRPTAPCSTRSISCCFGSPFPGEDIAPGRRHRPRRPRP